MQPESAPHGAGSTEARTDASVQPEARASSGAPTRDERQWAMLCHVSAMLMYVTALGGLLVPFVIWLLKRDEMPFVADQGKETVNFQITILLGLALSLPLVFVVIGWFTALALLAYHLVATVIAAVKVTEGVAWRYPFCWRVIR